jgi:hypothetical protein
LDFDAGVVDSILVESVLVELEKSHLFLQGMPIIIIRRQGNINIFKDLPRGNGDDSFGGLDQIVAFTSAMLAAERIDEAESRSELLGLN